MTVSSGRSRREEQRKQKRRYGELKAMESVSHRKSRFEPRGGGSRVPDDGGVGGQPPGTKCLTLFSVLRSPILLLRPLTAVTTICILYAPLCMYVQEDCLCANPWEAECAVSEPSGGVRECFHCKLFSNGNRVFVSQILSFVSQNSKNKRSSTVERTASHGRQAASA